MAALGLVMTAVFGAQLESRLAAIDAPAPVVEALREQQDRWGASQAPATDAATDAAVDTVIDESFVAGFRVIAWIAASLALLSAAVAAVMIRGVAEVADAAANEVSHSL